jgi:hypothetical protein
MAIERFFICDNGHKTWPDYLFDALKEVAEGNPHSCHECKGSAHLRLKFSFGLEAGPHDAKVLNVFLPDPIYKWKQKDRSIVEHYPFLVLVENIDDREIGSWWPYWHITTKGNYVQRKYGQWAPFIGQANLASLLQQARQKGYNV